MMITNPASQVVAALLVGLLVAFTCQLLLTNLGLAIGITIWGGPSWTQDNASHAKSDETDDSTSSSISLETLSIAAGLGLLLTVNGVLFVACYVAVKFCLPQSVFAGAVLGWVVWSAYLLIMTWVSTRAANSLVAFILSSAVSGLRQILAVLGSLLQSTFGSQESPLTPAATTELVRQETQLALGQLDIPTLIEEYIDEQMPPQLQLEALQPQLENTLQTSDLGRSEPQGVWSQINLSTFAQWVKEEVGLAGDVGDAIANLLNQVWQNVIRRDASPLQQLQDLFATASVDEILPEPVSRLLERWSQDSRQPVAPSCSQPSIAQPFHPSANLKTLEPAEDTNVARKISQSLKRMLRQRLDLTDLDIQTIWSRMAPLLPDGPSDADSSPNLQVIREDVDDYLQQVFPWRLHHATLQPEFREVLLDPEAAADQVLPQLQALSPQDFARSLQQRGDLKPERIDELVTELEAIRQAAIANLRESINGDHSAEAADEDAIDRPNESAQSLEKQTEAIAELQKGLENYLHYTSLSQITSEAIAHKVETLVEESPLAAADLHQASPHLPTDALSHVLDSRRGLDAAQRDQWIQQIQEAWQHYTASDESINPEVIVAIEGVLILTIAQIIRHHVNVQDVLPQLMTSLETVTRDPRQWRRSLTQINWQALRHQAQVQLESSEADIEQAIQPIQVAVVDLLKPPKRWALRRSAEVKDFGNHVAEYLSHSYPDQLSPAAVRHNLAWLWQASNQALDALPNRPAESADISLFDWHSLRDTLTHRQDLTADQIEAIGATLEQFTQSLRDHVNQARQQAQASLESWLTSVKTILQDAELRTFDPDQLKAKLRSFLQTSPDVFAALRQPLKSLQVAEDSAAAIAQLSQDALQPLLKASGVPKALLTQADELQTWMQARITAAEQEMQHQQAALTQAALQQVNEARKAVAVAAWWLFAIAITSGTTATVAGILAVTGFDVIAINFPLPWQINW